ncbi:hypothetical protein, partial [Azohydromonas aeria]|uniref:hypothetical protein n=1 Tax=Azohydromonas aeria TaxID=2590212 RepID=UPI0035C24A20
MAQARNNAPRAPGAPARPDAATPASEAGRPLRWSPGPGFFALGAPVAALALLIIGAALHVPGGWGIEDFLGWTEGRRGGAGPLLVHLWAQSGRTLLAWLYLGLDSLVFVPLYGGALLALAVRLAQALGADRFAERARREDMALRALVPPVLALALVDLMENGIGLSRIGSAGPWLALASTGLGAALVQWGGTLRHLMPRVGGGASATTALLALGTLGAATAGVPACLPPGAEWLSALGCGAHAGKGWLAALVGALFAATALGWLAGVALPADAPAELRAQRLRLRSAVRDMLLRSRYVLLALAALAVLLLGPDAGRDALYAIAASPFRAAQADLDERLLRAFGTLGAFAVTAAALWTLLFACWLWTRAACQLRRAHSPVPAPGAAPAPGHALARDWAAIVSFMPAALVALLTAQVVREAALAQAAGATAPWLGPVLLLAGFGLAVLALGAASVAWQRQADTDAAPGYDALSWAQWAAAAGVLCPRGDAARPAAAWRFAALVPPQGLLALLLVALLLVRAIDLLPAAGLAWQLDRLPTLGLAAALLSVALWLCVFGWLSLLEVATARPWVLLLVPALALLAALGWTANDAVWPAVAHADAAVPAGGLRMLAFTALLGGVLLLAQALLLARARRRAAVAQGLAPRAAPGWSALLPAALALLLGGVL